MDINSSEWLGMLIDLAARHAGLESSAYDITYEWRAW
jgi:hypothetical protein